ncbi:MAG TPA: PKD domain-containing protein [Thermoplasmata archaeon]|nr:PKD domain-containing protein [Thermoplasmata archaeon]
MNTNLRWSSNAQSYNVYLGKTTPSPLLVSSWTSTFFDPGSLEYETTYYWKIVAHSKDGQLKESSTWSFTTAKKNIGDPGSGQNQPPQADFNFLPTTPKTDEEVFFQDESTDNDGDIVSWYWEFGDNHISVERNPVHVYTKTGVYTVTLTVEDNSGAKNSTYNSLVVIDTQEDDQNTTPLSIRIVKPEKAFYFNNKRILTLHTPIVIGSINIEVQVSGEARIEKIEFYIDDELKATDTTKPYAWTWSEKTLGRHIIKAVAYGNTGERVSDETIVTKFL